MWTLLLFLFTMLLFLLPLMPGIWELLRPTDVQPLRVAQDYDNNPMHFSESFSGFVRKFFPDLKNSDTTSGRMTDGKKYQIVGTKGVPTLDASSITTKLILSAHTLTLPAGELFESEVYSEQDIYAGERSHFRALLAHRTLHLREHCTILRWAHSDYEMIVGHHSQLFGRATSNQRIMLGDNVHFERLHAPTIMATTAASEPLIPPAAERTLLTSLPDTKFHSEHRWVLGGHLQFPAYHSFIGDIVTGTTALVADYAHIQGSLKSNAHQDVVYHLQNSGVMAQSKKKTASCELGYGVRIDGSLISSHDLHIGKHCRIVGPVIAENLLVIGEGTIIGTPENPTTVNAEHIIMESGSIVHGTLWANKGGKVRHAAHVEAVI